MAHSNDPQPEQIEALTERMRGIATSLTRIQLGKLLKTTDKQLLRRLTRNIRAVGDPERPSSGITTFTIRTGDREYQLINYWEQGKSSFTTNEVLVKAKELEAEGNKNDLDWFHTNRRLVERELTEVTKYILVFTGFQNRGRRTVPYLSGWSSFFGETISFKGEASLWRLDHTWFVKRIK